VAIVSRAVQLVLLCEDTQHETFARRFLAKAGWSIRRLRVEKSPKGRGSAAQYVRERFPTELAAYRSNRNRVAQALVVFVDGDKAGVAGRLKEFDNACEGEQIEPRKQEDSVLMIVPVWNIETWLAYLDGTMVDESKSDYPRLDRPRDCQRHVDQLFEMCQKNALRQPAPQSLVSACDEYRERMPP
jgi:hypothetical protein